MSRLKIEIFCGVLIFMLCSTQCSAGCASLDSVSGNCLTSNCETETGLSPGLVACFNRSQNTHICNFEPYQSAVPSELGVKVEQNAFQLPDAHFTASSNDDTAKYARIGLPSNKMWCAADNDNNTWLKIDLGVMVPIERIELEPAGQKTVTNFTISYRNTTSDQMVSYQNEKQFSSTNESTCHYLFILKTDVIQINSNSCFRVAIYGRPPARMAAPLPLGVRVPPESNLQSYYRIPDEDFTSSSNQNNAKYARIGLPNDKLWCADNNDNNAWLEIVLDVAKTVERIDVQGNPNNPNWEQKFTLKYREQKDGPLSAYRQDKVFTSKINSSSHYISIQNPYSIRIVSKNSVSDKTCYRVAISGDRKTTGFNEVVQEIFVAPTSQPTAIILDQNSLSSSEFLKGYLLWAIFLAVFLFVLILSLVFLFCGCCRREREFPRQSEKQQASTHHNYTPSWRTIDEKAEKGYIATQEVQEVKIAFTDEYIPPDLQKEKVDPNDENLYRHKIFSFRGSQPAHHVQANGNKQL